MKSSEFIYETHHTGEMPPVDKAYLNNTALSGANKIADVSATLSLYSKEESDAVWYSLVKMLDVLVGTVKIRTEVIAGTHYSHINIIHIAPEFRNTTAIKWLLYAIKEFSKYPVIASGAIFKQGGELINSLLRHDWMHTFVLNKTTGEISKFTAPIFDIDYCYLFKLTKEGFGKNYFSEDATKRDAGWIWYPIFDDI